MRRCTELSKVRFELLDDGAADVAAAAQHIQHRLVQVVPQIGQLNGEVEGRDVHEGKLKGFLHAI